MIRGARDWSCRPTTPSSLKRFLNFSPVFLEIPYSRHRSVSFSPRPNRTTISIRRSTGLLAFQGTVRSAAAPYQVSPMYPVYYVTHVPGLHPALRNSEPKKSGVLLLNWRLGEKFRFSQGETTSERRRGGRAGA